MCLLHIAHRTSCKIRTRCQWTDNCHTFVRSLILVHLSPSRISWRVRLFSSCLYLFFVFVSFTSDLVGSMNWALRISLLNCLLLFTYSVHTRCVLYADSLCSFASRRSGFASFYFFSMRKRERKVVQWLMWYRHDSRWWLLLPQVIHRAYVFLFAERIIFMLMTLQCRWRNELCARLS